MLELAVIRTVIVAILTLAVLAVTTSSATPSSKQSAPKTARDTSESNGPFKDVEFSYYDTMNLMGSCGTQLTDFDLIVALSLEQYGNGEHCNKKIVITVDGKSQTGAVADKCVSCASKRMWMSPSLFGLLAGVGDNVDFSDLSRKTDAQVLLGEWSFANDGSE